MGFFFRYRPPDVLLGSTEYSTQIDMWYEAFFLYFQARHSQAFSVIIWEETTEMTKQVITKTQWTLFKELF